MSDQELRLHAMQLAVAYITEHVEIGYDLIPTAKEIYEFIKGEN
jgi:hypothetical protein